MRRGVGLVLPRGRGLPRRGFSEDGDAEDNRRQIRAETAEEDTDASESAEVAEHAETAFFSPPPRRSRRLRGEVRRLRGEQALSQ